MNKYFYAENLEQLDQIANSLLPLIKERKKVAFVGEIGAGKTTFIKILCQKLGVKETTSSPTFSIINQYQSPSLNIYHIDLYRLKSEEEAFSIGLMELLDQNNYCMIEWPTIVESYLPDDAIWIKITIEKDSCRKFNVFFE